MASSELICIVGNEPIGIQLTGKLLLPQHGAGVFVAMHIAHNEIASRKLFDVHQPAGGIWLKCRNRVISRQIVEHVHVNSLSHQVADGLADDVPRCTRQRSR